MRISLEQVVGFLDARLRVRETGDYPQALNGLQFGDSLAPVTSIAAAVDASLATVTKAVAAGCDLLLVHHGLFWNGLQPVTGRRHELFRTALDGGLAIYSAHLPLDTGTEGNSALLAAALAREDQWLGAATWQPFFEAKGVEIGCRGSLPGAMPLDRLTACLSQALDGGPVRVCPGGSDSVREVGIITGAAGSEVRAVAAQGIDTLITGEGPHWTYALAEEAGVNILYGGHYATETFGVKKLAATLHERFGLPWQFIDHPTGL